MRVPPVLRGVDRFTVSELALFADARVHAAECKAGFGILQDYFAVNGGPDAHAAVDPDGVIDVTALVDADGVLRWDPPAGSWRILRFGASLTGSTNGPAPAEATGLEVDKLDGVAVRRHLDAYLAIATPAGALHGLLSDSIESGPQNWTPRLREEFADRRGYDLLPWLPAVVGLVVRDAPATDRFLFDLRRTIADLVAEQYYGTLRDEAHRRGLTYYAEALEDHRPQLGDDLAMRAAADVPMGAMWLFDPGTGSPAPTYVADLKGASSVAHLYGKRWTGAESMTAFHRPWSYSPRHLKHVADLELALGVTRFCIHTSPHQPVGTPPPGIGLAPFLGQAFVRSEPWAELAGPWIDYLARCSAVLNAGTPSGGRRGLPWGGGSAHRPVRRGARHDGALPDRLRLHRPGSARVRDDRRRRRPRRAWGPLPGARARRLQPLDDLPCPPPARLPRARRSHRHRRAADRDTLAHRPRRGARPAGVDDLG